MAQNTSMKKKRYSKNKKKNWRKFIDVSDIQEAQLQNQPPTDDSANNEEEDVFDFSEILNVGKPLESRRKKCEQKKYKCHNLLDGLVGAKPVGQKQAGPRPQLPKAVKKLIKLEGKSEKAKQKKKQVEMNRQRSKSHRNFLSHREFLQRTGDLWKGKSTTNKQDEGSKSFMKEGLDHYMKVTKPGVRPGKKRAYRPSLIPSVIVPGAGAAYNPGYKHHQKLLKKVKKKSV